MAFRIDAAAICEKPLVINPWNLDQLARVEEEYQGKINTILQLRVHPALVALKEKIDADKSGKQHEVLLSYVTSRGPWYHTSWKGNSEKSGGVATNIGIHFFDMLQWLFGKPGLVKLHRSTPQSMSGFVEFERAQVRWFLSVDENDLPVAIEPGKPKTYRSITVNGDEIEFSGGFTDLHTRVYERTLAGNGFGLDDARPSIELVYNIRNTPLTAVDALAHPFLKK